MTQINLAKNIHDAILVDGPMALDHFMSIVIPYYYSYNNAIGKNGDFITAPEISQLFGEIIGIWAANRWITAGRPEFILVEMGGGTGTLMQDFLRGTKLVNHFHYNMKKIYMVEQSHLLIEKQKQNLKSYIDKIEWISDTDKIKEKDTLIIISNELFDALPIKQFMKCNDGLREMYVVIDDNNNFAFRPYGVAIKDTLHKTGDIMEACVIGEYIAMQLAEKLKQQGGFFLTIDYGYMESSQKSTLQAVKNHKPCDPLKCIGKADITSHVDFKLLAGCFIQQGLKCSITSQTNFLVKYGIKERVNMLIQQGGDYKEYIQQMDRLIAKEQMGNLFKALEVISL